MCGNASRKDPFQHLLQMAASGCFKALMSFTQTAVFIPLLQVRCSDSKGTSLNLCSSLIEELEKKCRSNCEFCILPTVLGTAIAS